MRWVLEAQQRAFQVGTQGESQTDSKPTSTSHRSIPGLAGMLHTPISASTQPWRSRSSRAMFSPSRLRRPGDSHGAGEGRGTGHKSQVSDPKPRPFHLARLPS